MRQRRLLHLAERTFERFSLGHVLRALRRSDARVFLVGGAVRDALRDPEVAPVDIDLMTADDLDLLWEPLRSLGSPRVNRHGNLRYQLGGGRHLDVIHTRRFYGRESDVARALLHFDVSVNALAVTIDGDDSLLDPLGGFRDLAEGRLSLPAARWAPGDPFEDVHVLLRAVKIVERMELEVKNPELALPHRDRFGEVDWSDLERLNGFGREEAERRYARVFSEAKVGHLEPSRL
jgi:tRNA nucleotidyltransferase/poly(A) polymerase